MNLLADKPYGDLEVRLIGHDDTTAYRIAISAHKLVDKKDMRWSEAYAYADTYAENFARALEVPRRFSVERTYDEKEREHNITLRCGERRPGESYENYMPGQNQVMIDLFEKTHALVADHMKDIDPISFKRSSGARRSGGW